MKCKICHYQETDSTSGICWECVGKFEIIVDNKEIEEMGTSGFGGHY